MRVVKSKEKWDFSFRQKLQEKTGFNNQRVKNKKYQVCEEVKCSVISWKEGLFQKEVWSFQTEKFRRQKEQR